MANMATGSSIAYRLGLEQSQEAADFWRAFSGAGFGVRGVSPCLLYTSDSADD